MRIGSYAALAVLPTLLACQERVMEPSVVALRGAEVRFVGVSGEPVPGARVLALGVEGADSSALLAVWVLGEGSRIPRGEIPLDASLLLARHAGVVGAAWLMDSAEDFEVELRSSASLQGRLRLEPGDPPMHSWIRIAPAGYAANPDRLGSFRIDSLPAGRWKVSLGTAHPDYFAMDTILDVQPGQTIDLGDVSLVYKKVRSVLGIVANSKSASSLAQIRWSKGVEGLRYRVWKAGISDTGRGILLGETTDTTWTDDLFPGVRWGDSSVVTAVYRVEAVDSAGRTGRIWGSARMARASPFLDSTLDPKWSVVELPIPDRGYANARVRPHRGGFLVSMLEYDLDSDDGLLAAKAWTIWLDSTGSMQTVPTDSLLTCPAFSAYGAIWWISPSRDHEATGLLHGRFPDGREIGPLALGTGLDVVSDIPQSPYPIVVGDTLQLTPSKALVVSGQSARIVMRPSTIIEDVFRYPSLGDGWSLRPAGDTLVFDGEHISRQRRGAVLTPPFSRGLSPLPLRTDRPDQGMRIGSRFLLWSHDWMGWTRYEARGEVYHVVQDPGGWAISDAILHEGKVLLLRSNELHIGTFPFDPTGVNR